MSEVRAIRVDVLERCRAVHGVEGAIDEANKRVKDAYMEAMTFEANKRATFRLELTIDRGEGRET